MFLSISFICGNYSANFIQTRVSSERQFWFLWFYILDRGENDKHEYPHADSNTYVLTHKLPMNILQASII